MPANETPAETVGGLLRAGLEPQVATSPDTIKGWNSRRKSNNQIISSLVPFVQLIGLFDEEEYNKMFKFANDKRTSVVFEDSSIVKTDAYNEKYYIDPNWWRNPNYGMTPEEQYVDEIMANKS